VTGARAPVTAQEVAVALLAAASGAVDAIAFTSLGHVFAGVMTGNLALLGVAVGGDRFADTVPPLVALAGFAAGTAAAARACRPGAAGGARWPVRTLHCLGCEAVLLAAVAVVWAAAGAPPSPGALSDVLLAAVAVAMGAQSGAMLGVGAAARPSTYPTGSLATFITRGVGGAPGEPGADRWVPVRLAALAVGAGAAVAVLRFAAGWTAFLPPVLVAAAVATAAAAGRPWRPRAAKARGGA
jgi:uncharacterized membrane protein YoaK (UPF0700 family)